MQPGAALAAGGTANLCRSGGVRAKRRADFGASWRLKASLGMLAGFVQATQSLRVVCCQRAVRAGLDCRVQRVSRLQGNEPKWSAS